MRAHGPFIPYGRQLIEEDDVAAVSAVLRSDFLTTGPAVAAFEEALAARVGSRFAVSCSSGTAGLHLAALAVGLGEGDVAMVPAITFIATANAGRYVGAEVAFVDVDPETGLVGEMELRAALDRAGDRVKAVFPVHLNGQCVDMEMVAGVAAERGLKVIEDASHAVGTTFRTNRGQTVTVGSCHHSDVSVFSFHPVKTIAMGEGGAVTTNDETLYQRLLRLRNHGIVRDSRAFENAKQAVDAGGGPNPWYYEMQELGFNYRASDIHCALGLSQLGKLDRFVAKRAALVHAYDERLKRLAQVVRPVGRVKGCAPAWHLYVTLIDFEAAGVDRATVMKRLRAAGIGTQVHYMPVHHQPYYRRRYGDLHLLGAEAYYARCLSLPLFPDMNAAEVGRVTDALHQAINPS